MKFFTALLLIACYTLTLPLPSRGESPFFKVPPLRGPVNDYAHIVPPHTEQQLNQALKTLKKLSGGTELAILTLPQLAGLSIEQASFRIVDQWGLGDRQKDNGVLLLIAQKERRIRIEVGQSHEATLTDAYAKRIIDEFMVPLMRMGKPSQSLLVGTMEIIKRIHPEIKMDSLLIPTAGSHHKKPVKSFYQWILIILFILLSIFGGRGGLLGFFMGSALGGRRRRHTGFGGGFSGGFGGGGGGFSGGGASGGW